MTKETHCLKQIFSVGEIKRIVASIGNDLSKDYHNRCPLVIYILEGARRFYYDLDKHLKFAYYVLSVNRQTYSGTKRQGNCLTNIDLPMEVVNGKDIILVDDIIDSGHCMDYFIKLCQGKNCLSVKTCTLLNKESKRETGYSPDYNGFIIDDVFVVGYGMDYNGQYRDLDTISELKIDENC